MSPLDPSLVGRFASTSVDGRRGNYELAHRPGDDGRPRCGAEVADEAEAGLPLLLRVDCAPCVALARRAGRA